jgi:hypothetical protein
MGEARQDNGEVTMKRLMLAQLAIAAALCGNAAGAAQTVVPLSVQANGTEFVVSLVDGRTLRSRELIGATLVMAVRGQAIRVRIDGVEPDPDAKGGTVWLHTLSGQMTDGSWQNLCDAGPDGRRQGFPIAGRPRADGMLEPAEPGTFELVCTSGAQGKCVRFGYQPWTTPNGTQSRDLYNACIRMVRADYCGNGTATTKDGQQIDIYDDHGIQKPENVPVMDFEAGWTPDGAACVRHVRVKENVSLESLVAACPRLEDRAGPACSEEAARGFGARLFNCSRP